MGIKTKSKKAAILLSYAATVIQALVTMILTRYYLNRLGSDTYGLYQMVYSVAQYILILDLGISTVMIRYISEYEVTGDRNKSENFAAHFALIVGAIAVIIVIIGIVINKNLENIYSNLTADEYILSHKMFSIMILQIEFTLFAHYLRGLCEANEQFVFTRTVSILQIILNLFLNLAFIEREMGIMGIVIANTVVICVNVIITMAYSIVVVKFKARFHSWEPSLLKPVFLLMVAMLLQSVVGHVNGSVDKTILGIMATKTDVTVYSIAATIITMFNTLPTTVSSVFQTSATKLIAENGVDGEKLTDFIIRPGRIQFFIIGGFLAGFILMGKDFIECWAGKGMEDAWQYVLIIMIPNAIPLMQSTCLSILNAIDKRIYRSIILVGITGINIGLTIILIPALGPFGAPLATGISYIIGHCVFMNIYYQKKIGLNIRRMFSGIMYRSWICIVSAGLLCAPTILWKCNGNWVTLIIKAAIFCTIYCFLLFYYGMNDDEKRVAQALISKLKHK